MTYSDSFRKSSEMIFHIKVYIFLSSIILFSFSALTARARISIDSLKGSLIGGLPDTQKINTLVRLAVEIPCDDTVSKIGYANQAIELAEKINWTKGNLATDIALGNIYAGCTGNYSKALTYFIRSDSLAVAEGDKGTQINALRSIAFYAQKSGHHKEAIDYYRQEQLLNTNADEDMGIWGNLGSAYNDIGDYSSSINAYYNSLKVLKGLQQTKKTHDRNDTMQTAGLLINIGDVYMVMSQPDKAYNDYDSVYKIGVAINNNLLETLGLMGIGKTCEKKNNHEKAIRYYQTALQKCYEKNDLPDQVQILNEIANAYLSEHNTHAAMEYGEKFLSLVEKTDDNGALPKAYITMGKIYVQNGLYNNAVTYLQKALGLSQITNALEDEKDAWDALSNAYEQLKMPAAAFDAYKHFISIQDSVHSIDKSNEFVRQELDFSYKNKQLEEKLIYDKKIARQQLIAYCGFGGLVLLSLLAFFMYRNYHTQKKYNELLSKEKIDHLAHIEAQDMALTDIAYIQSHNVRGPVATILGLVNLFNMEYPADPVNKEVIEGLTEVTQQLDTVVKEVILKENKLKREQSSDHHI